MYIRLSLLQNHTSFVRQINVDGIAVFLLVTIFITSIIFRDMTPLSCWPADIIETLLHYLIINRTLLLVILFK